jgi:hypothetical protein
MFRVYDDAGVVWGHTNKVTNKIAGTRARDQSRIEGEANYSQLFREFPLTIIGRREE